MTDMHSPDTRPRVSVVIPSYNHARFLPETIASVLDQTLPDWELIIIDDGSRDASWEIIQGHVAKEPRVRAQRQANGGAHAAINAGLQLARGEFLAILNSDDRYHPERLATLCALAEREGLDFLCTGQRLIDRDGNMIEDHPWLQEYGRMVASARQGGLWQALLERNFTVSTSNFFMRRSLWQALGPIRPLRYNMDWDYALRALQHSPQRFAWKHELALWDYRLHGNNTILDGLPRSAIEANHVLYRNLVRACSVPTRAIAGLRRHYRLIRQQQVAAVAEERDAYWEARLQEAHQGWAETRAESDATHARLGETLTQLGEARTALGDTQARLGSTQAELEASRGESLALRQELAAVYASRSYRLGRKLTAPLRWLRERSTALRAQPAPEATPATVAPDSATAPVADTTPPPYRKLDLAALPAAPSAQPTVAAHLHVHYVELLPELLDAVANIPGQFDLYVTTTQPAAGVAATVHARFPRAQVWQTANQGKDIGPFIDALQRYKLQRYDLVLKLHGKKSRNDPSYLEAVRALCGRDLVDGDDWRRRLIRPIAGSPERIRQIWRAFEEDARLGMVGAARFICEAPDASPQAYARLCERLGVGSGIRFFGGTMFWIRGPALVPFIDAGLTLEDFDPAKATNVEGTLEHGCERVFGALAARDGGCLGGVDDLS